LKLYGIEQDAYDGDEQMFDLIHQMRARLITSPSFTGDKVIAADPVRTNHGPNHQRRGLRGVSVEAKTHRAVCEVAKGLSDAGKRRGSS